MNFEPRKKDIQVAARSLRAEFDVRGGGNVDMFAAEEMASHGRIDNTLVTRDMVIVDGRTGAIAQQLKNGTLDDPNALVTVDILGFDYDSATKGEQAEIRAEALRRNYSTRGYRRFATEEDVTTTLAETISLNVAKAQIKELFSFLGSRFEKLYANADNSVRQQKISAARQLMKEDSNLTPAQAAKAVGLSSPAGIIPTQGEPARDKQFNELKAKQAALRKALTAVTNYATQRVKWLREGKISGLTVNRLYDYETKNMVKLVKVHEDAKNRVGKEVARIVPGFHTK